MKKNKLETSYSYDFQLIGLLSYVKEYKLAWTINQALNIGLKKEDDIALTFLDNRSLSISNYIYRTEYGEVRLLRNRSCNDDEPDAAYLLPEARNFDYLLIINDESDAMNADKALERLTGNKSIQYAARIEVNKLKSRENLIF